MKTEHSLAHNLDKKKKKNRYSVKLPKFIFK